MKLALIAPLKHLDLARYGSIHMALACFHYYDKYKEFYRKEKKYKIVDNGAAEGAQVTVDTQMKFAKAIKASEIVLQDVLLKGKETIESTRGMLSVLNKRERKLSLMGVPQGRTPQEYLECVKKMIKLDINIIGISKIAVAHAFGKLLGTNDIMTCRRCVLEQLAKKFTIIPERIHLLGMGNIYEPLFYNNIRSIDSCYPISKMIYGEEKGMLRTKSSKAYFNIDIKTKKIEKDLKKYVNLLNK